MRAWTVVGVLVVVALAGCSEPPAPEEPGEAAAFDDLDVQVDDTTGAVLGVVVNDVIVPVEGAAITLQDGSGRSSETDAEGRFVLDGLDAGTYFLTAAKPGHAETQFSAEVVPGTAEPPVLKVQLPRLFEADPFMQGFAYEGFFTCSQAGVLPLWGSSPCVFDQTKHPLVPPAANGPAPFLDDATPQERDFHVDVGAGWQSLVWEMTWEPSAQGTSANMGMVASTYKPERCTCHNFASVSSASPLRLQLDTGVIHDTANDEEPRMVPEEGIQQMSFFTSARPDGLMPGISLDQDFTIYHHQFYYAAPPEGWSFLAGDGNPF